jgi:hypothetical protein
MPRNSHNIVDLGQANFPGAEYTADETDFIMAMDRYKRGARRPFPTWLEVLTVAKSRGWRKVVPDGEKTDAG